MIASERRLYIMNCLNHKGIVNLKEIAAELNISEITVRRDFEKLEKAGKLKRVLGGAALEDVLDNAELTMKEKMSLNTGDKVKVAEYASRHIKDGDCVFVDGGTSVALIVNFIADRRIKIVTHNELVIRKLVNPVAEIFVIGGKYLPYYNMNVGPVAQDTLKQYHFDVGIFGCSGVDINQNMSYTTEMESLLMKKIALENSTYNMLLIDASKIQKKSFLRFTQTDSFDAIICNKHENNIKLPSNYHMI